jgi:ribosomal protein L24
MRDQQHLSQGKVIIDRAAQAPVYVERPVAFVEQRSHMTTEAPVVIRHDEAPIHYSNVSQATVITHQEAPIHETIVNQPIIKDSHKEIVHEHH